MKFNKYKLKKSIILEKSAEEYLDNDFEGLIELFLKYLNDECIEIYNEDSLKFELGTFLRIILPKYHVNFEKNIRNFTHNTKTRKHEIDITIYPKEDNKDNANENKIKKTVYAIELKFPSFKTEEGKKEYNKGGNKILENLEKDMVFVAQLVDNDFKNAWSFVLVSEIASPIYQFPKKCGKASEIYNKFRGFDSEGNSMWNEENESNPHKLKWKDWKDKKGSIIGKYYIKSGHDIEIKK